MRLTIVLIIATMMQVSAACFAQRITLNQKNITMEKVFREIHAQTGYDFIYNRNLISKKRLIDINVNSQDLTEVLDHFLSNQALDYKIKNKTIVISKKEKGVVSKPNNFVAAPYTVSGQVLTESGEAIKGTTIKVKGTTTSTSTDKKGWFSIVISNDPAVLIITFLGFCPKEVPVNSTVKDLTIKMVESDSKLNEVQVVAYGTTTRKLNTGSVSTITASEISKQPILNPLQALQGRATGVFISQNSGISGSNYRIQIEGQNSLRNSADNNGNLPLYVIDGVPFSSASLSTTGLAPYSFTPVSESNGASPLNSINPQDIESIDILKDADATAIYGSRGANGVILITTKKGKSGAMQVDANIYSGMGRVTQRMDLLNLNQYLSMREEALRNDNISEPGFQDYDLNGAWDRTRSTDWQKELLGGVAHMSDAQLSIMGGNTNTQYRIGGGYHRETSVFKGSNTNSRASFTSNLSTKSDNNKFKANIGVNYAYSLADLIGGDLTSDALTLAPNAPTLFDASGKLNWENNTFVNPLKSTQIPYRGKTYNLIVNGSFSYQLSKNLNLSTNLGYTSTNLDELRKAYSTSVNPQRAANFRLNSNFGNNSNISWIAEPQINWDKTFGRNHLHVLLGGSLQNQETKLQSISAYGFISEGQMDNPGAVPATDVTITPNYAEYKYGAIFGRITYDWDKKYLVNISARRDGSSRFGPNKQFANFGAVGMAWIFSKEKFITSALPFLSFGKLRASYGITGSDQIGNYQFLNNYSLSGEYQSIRGLFPARLYNPDFQWEVNKKMEIALESGFLSNRILATISYYRNRSSDQLLGYPLAPTTGFTTIQFNLPATVQNTGLGLELTTVNMKRKDFSWSSNFNLTIPRNKLVSFENLEGSPYANEYVIGEPLSIQKSYHVTGVDPTTGLYQIEDVNKDGAYNSDDYSSIEYTGQKFYGGLGNTISYKNFQLDFFFQYVKQSGPNFLTYFGMPGEVGNQSVAVLNRWQQNGQNADIQRFGTFSGEGVSPFFNYLFSNRNISDASYIRLKNVAISYQLPKSTLQKMKVKNVRVYLQGQNVLTFTRYSGLDPETQGLSLPPLQYLTAGLQITL